MCLSSPRFYGGGTTVPPPATNTQDLVKMNQNDLHSFLRKKTIEICELPEEDIVELDKEVADAQDRYPTRKRLLK